MIDMGELEGLEPKSKGKKAGDYEVAKNRNDNQRYGYTWDG